MIHLTRRGLVFGGFAAALGSVAEAKRRKNRYSTKRKPDERPPHEVILSGLAGRMGHGFRDEKAPLETLEARLVAGERIEVLCGTQSALGTRALERANIHARVVGALTHEPFTGVADGHIMIEAHIDRRWLLYDLTANAQAIDGQGRGISIVDLCATTHRRWRRIANDPLWSAEQVAEHSAPWLVDTEAWYERVLGTPWVKDEVGYNVFHDPVNEERIVASFPWAFPVDVATWRLLMA